jgi:hypothetical protein
VIQRKSKTPRQSKAQPPLPRQDLPASVYQHMHTINDGIERAVLSITELADNEVFEKPDMIYRALQLRELQSLLSAMMSQRVADHEYVQAELLGERVHPGVRSTLLS